MTAHTPGPWAVTKHATPDYAPQHGVYAEGSGTDLAIVRGDNATADAALIAASPDLLAACETVAADDWYCECDNTHANNGTVCRSCFNANILRAAIAKARGTSNG